jgi:hypothetical protein
MNSAGKDSSEPLCRLPISVEKIMRSIRDPLKRCNGAKEFDRAYPKIEPVLAKLVELGIDISASPSCSHWVTSKLRIVANMASAMDSTTKLIRQELSRDILKRVTAHCEKGHVVLFVALVESWLRACEEHVRTLLHDEKIVAFEKAQEQLITIVKEVLYVIVNDNRSYLPLFPDKVPDHLLHILTSFKLP